MKYYPLRGLRAKGRLIQKKIRNDADFYESYFKRTSVTQKFTLSILFKVLGLR